MLQDKILNLTQLGPQRTRRLSEGTPPNRPELEGADNVLDACTTGLLLRSARPLGLGMEGALKERLGVDGVMRGAGEEKLRVDGRESVRGAEMLGMEGGLLIMLLPRKVEGRVTWEA